MTCTNCGTELYRRNKSGLCRVCINVDPEAKAKRQAALKAKWAADALFRARASRITHIPPQLREEYRYLRRSKGLRVSDAVRVLRGAHPAAFAEHESLPETPEDVLRAEAAEARRLQHLTYRIRILPEQLDGARRKVAALENEARRLGMTDLLDKVSA